MSIERLTEIIKNSNNIVFFGGAGVSTESNIPDFRSANGLYNENANKKFSPEQILSHSYFMRYTENFYKFYRDKMIYKDAKPNKAHLALSELEKLGKLKAVITQNIDGLHQMAGSKEVLELHGSIHRNTCMNCGKHFDLNYILSSDSIIPKCDACNSTVKPDVVLYEEGLDDDVIRNTVDYISKADILIIGGTSLVVYPAAGLIRYFRGKHLILINKSSTPYDNEADLVINDSIGNVLNACYEALQ
ncbi:NAD-dependent deacetylase [Clostridium cavendishii DSM 21758]|uniref:NAD-dependent protein deacetylase n=1 Tax=Clostridium cavendishii DSM 21758 TaxID=1121302 RepID=A0A1M6V8B1_9CLOT|nr:NAD-dependent protein deacylase [Clostridium cavendishii]SHK77723.1 NAD-dependent deacetylase [Clostridium cavendishii DSM 21758]